MVLLVIVSKLQIQQNLCFFIMYNYKYTSATRNNYNYIIISSSTFFSVCYAAQAYTYTWVSYVAQIYYYAEIYSTTCGSWWDEYTCYGYRSR